MFKFLGGVLLGFILAQPDIFAFLKGFVLEMLGRY